MAPELTEYEIGDLAKYKTIVHGWVRGEIIDMFDDPTNGHTLIFRVTSKEHRLYPAGLEFEIFNQHERLRKRKRYSH